MKYITCTFCNRFGRKSKDESCCISCNIAFDRAGDFEPILTSRRCRGCDTRLPQTRYFQCLDCKPEMETECPFDSSLPLETNDDNRLQSAMAKKKSKDSGRISKQCKECKIERLMTLFGLVRSMKDGRSNTCKPCHLARARRRHLEAVQKALEVAA